MNPRLPLVLVLGLGRVLAADLSHPPVPPLFSEDFETGKLDPAVWFEQTTGGNQIAVQSENAAHGKFALRVRCPAPSQKTWALISTHHLPSGLRKHHFGRAYVLITPKPPTRHIILLMAGTPGFPYNKFEEVATAHGDVQLTYVDLHPEGSNEDYHSQGEMPAGRWFCLEWEFNDNPDRAAVWIDGEKILETGFVSKVTHGHENLVGAFTDFSFGFRLWGAAPEPFDVYYDDIALGLQPIGQIPGALPHPRP